MKTILPLVLISVSLAFSSCASAPKITVPPGSLTSWTHTDNYGPFIDHVILTGVKKNPDGSFTVQHYDGQAGWLGFGPHDVIEGLEIDAAGTPAAPAK